MRVHAWMACQCRTRCQITAQLRARIGGRKDREAGYKWARLASGRAESLRGKMQLRQRLPSGASMPCGLKRSPGGRISVKIEALRRFMHLVHALAMLDCGLALCVCKHTRHSCSMGVQMLQKSVLLQQSFSVAHAAMVALDKYWFALSRHYGGGGKWPRARTQNLKWAAELGKLDQQRTHFFHRQRRPVGLRQRAIHPVRSHRRGHCMNIFLLNQRNNKCAISKSVMG